MYLHGGDIYRNVGAIDFSANINFLGMPESVKEAAHKGVELSIHYPQMQNTGLTEAIAGYDAENDMMWGMNEQNYVCGNGAAEIIFSFADALQPKKVFLPAPTFYEYEQALTAKVPHCTVQKYYLSKNNSFDITEDILNQITEDIELVCVCNPNNPTGRLIEKSLILQMIAACKRVGAWFLADESFMELVKGHESYTICRDIQSISYDRLLILKSFTKLFAMPGLRLGYGISPNKALIQKMKDSLQPWNISLPAQCAGIAAISEIKEHRFDEWSRERIAGERIFLYNELKKLENTYDCFKVYEGAANFLLFEVQNEPQAEWLAEKCLEKGMLLRSCSNFDGLGAGWYRTAVRDRADNEQLVETLRETLKALTEPSDIIGQE
ncbi:MAG: aminotransferase class I/II-fold pyridoxal phosphate-dependent enzyme [Lachnospiraceae bacterium]|nr:aminotransferase class I/II-fold pyridoxal phosphate-dependent enzyme [Lachnospiraceae bacterium]